MYLYFVSLPINWTIHRNVITEKQVKEEIFDMQTSVFPLKFARSERKIQLKPPQKTTSESITHMFFFCMSVQAFWKTQTVADIPDIPWKGCVTMVAQERAIISLVVCGKGKKKKQMKRMYVTRWRCQYAIICIFISQRLTHKSKEASFKIAPRKYT